MQSEIQLNFKTSFRRTQQTPESLKDMKVGSGQGKKKIKNQSDPSIKQVITESELTTLVKKSHENSRDHFCPKTRQRERESPSRLHSRKDGLNENMSPTSPSTQY